jgi:hypothetical protein
VEIADLLKVVRPIQPMQYDRICDVWQFNLALWSSKDDA